MGEKHLATLANFNCTFKVDNETYGMLDFFESIIWPALNDKKLMRIVKKDKRIHTRFHISDLHLVEIEDGLIALVGKHIKRTLLEISPDYDTNVGFFGESDIRPSAPYSTFIILLNNHRVIYFPNKSGAPDIRSFASTINDILRKYIHINRRILKEQLKANNYIFDGIKYDYIQTFTSSYLEKVLPFPELNVVPIESPELAKQAFANIKNIKKVTFKFYKPNNEPIDFNNFFARSFDVLDATGSSSLNQTLNAPTKNEVIQEAVTSSEGKTDYKVFAVDNNSEPLELTPDKITQKVPIQIHAEHTIESTSKEVYNQVKNKKILTEVSETNKKTYLKIFDFLKTLL